MKSLLVYLASPYSGSMELQQKRFEEVARAFAWLTNHYSEDKLFFYSPIASCHPINLLHLLPGDWNYWSDYDKLMIDRSDEVWVLCIDGWDKSVGVTAEREYALSVGKKVLFLRKLEDGTYDNDN